MFNLTANDDLFDRDDLLQGTPEGAYRVAHSIIALIMRVGEGAFATERAAGKFLHGKAQQTVQLTQIVCMGHDQRPHHYLHPTSRHCSTSCRQHARLLNAGACRALLYPPFDPTALRPLQRGELL